MVRAVDSAGRDTGPQRPSGYVDPYQVALSLAVPIIRDLIAVRIDASQGMEVWVINCEAVPRPPVCASCGVTLKGSARARWAVATALATGHPR